MHFKLISPSEPARTFDVPENAGFDRARIVSLLQELEQRSHTFELVDGDALPEEERVRSYFEGASVAVRDKTIRVSPVFGSARKGGGPHFGRGVPALLVYQFGEPIGVYPHERQDGSHATIREYLEELRADEPQ